MLDERFRASDTERHVMKRDAGPSHLPWIYKFARDDRAKLPFATAAIVLFMVSGAASTVMVQVQESEQERLRVESINDAADFVATQLKEQARTMTEVALLALPLAHLGRELRPDVTLPDFAAAGTPDVADVTRTAGSYFDMYMKRAFPLEASGAVVDVYNAQLSVAEGTPVVKDVRPETKEGSAEPTGYKPSMDADSPGTIADGPAKNYYRVTGGATVVVNATGTLVRREVVFDEWILDSSPFVRDKLAAFKQIATGPDSEVGRLVTYILTTQAQWRSLNGAGSGLIEYARNPTPDMERFSSEMLDQADVELAINLAFALTTARYFRTTPVDAQGTPVNEAFAKFGKTGTLDAADVILLTTVGNFQQKIVKLDLRALLAQSMYTVIDQLIVKYLEYFYVTDLVDFVTTVVSAIEKFFEAIGEFFEKLFAPGKYYKDRAQKMRNMVVNMVYESSEHSDRGYYGFRADRGIFYDIFAGPHKLRLSVDKEWHHSTRTHVDCTYDASKAKYWKTEVDYSYYYRFKYDWRTSGEVRMDPINFNLLSFQTDAPRDKDGNERWEDTIWFGLHQGADEILASIQWESQTIPNALRQGLMEAVTSAAFFEKVFGPGPQAYTLEIPIDWRDSTSVIETARGRVTQRISQMQAYYRANPGEMSKFFDSAFEQIAGAKDDRFERYDTWFRAHYRGGFAPIMSGVAADRMWDRIAAISESVVERVTRNKADWATTCTRASPDDATVGEMHVQRMAAREHLRQLAHGYLAGIEDQEARKFRAALAGYKSSSTRKFSFSNLIAGGSAATMIGSVDSIHPQGLFGAGMAVLGQSMDYLADIERTRNIPFRQEFAIGEPFRFTQKATPDGGEGPTLYDETLRFNTTVLSGLHPTVRIGGIKGAHWTKFDESSTTPFEWTIPVSVSGSVRFHITNDAHALKWKGESFGRAATVDVPIDLQDLRITFSSGWALANAPYKATNDLFKDIGELIKKAFEELLKAITQILGPLMDLISFFSNLAAEMLQFLMDIIDVVLAPVLQFLFDLMKDAVDTLLGICRHLWDMDLDLFGLEISFDVADKCPSTECIMNGEGCATGQTDAPRGLTATTGDEPGTVRLSWSAPADTGGSAISGYRIYKSSTSQGPFTLRDVVGNVGQYVDRDNPSATPFYYRVSAVNGRGEGLTSSVASATSAAGAPGAPTNLRAQAAPDAARVSLSWNPPANNGGSPLTRYFVYRALTANGPFEQVAEVAAPQTAFTDGSVHHALNNFYVVHAGNALGLSGASSKAVATTVPGPPAPPRDAKAEPGQTPGEVVVTWKMPVSNGGSPVTAYRVYRSASESGAFTLLQELADWQLEFTDSELPMDRLHHYKVTAVTARGEGPPSPGVSAQATPGASGGTTPSGGSSPLRGASGALPLTQGLSQTRPGWPEETPIANFIREQASPENCAAAEAGTPPWPASREPALPQGSQRVPQHFAASREAGASQLKQASQAVDTSDRMVDFGGDAWVAFGEDEYGEILGAELFSIRIGPKNQPYFKMSVVAFKMIWPSSMFFKDVRPLPCAAITSRIPIDIIFESYIPSDLSSKPVQLKFDLLGTTNAIKMEAESSSRKAHFSLYIPEDYDGRLREHRVTLPEAAEKNVDIGIALQKDLPAGKNGKSPGTFKAGLKLRSNGVLDDPVKSLLDITSLVGVAWKQAEMKVPVDHDPGWWALRILAFIGFLIERLLRHALDKFDTLILYIELGTAAGQGFRIEGYISDFSQGLREIGEWIYANVGSLLGAESADDWNPDWLAGKSLENMGVNVFIYFTRREPVPRNLGCATAFGGMWGKIVNLVQKARGITPSPPSQDVQVDVLRDYQYGVYTDLTIPVFMNDDTRTQRLEVGFKRMYGWTARSTRELLRGLDVPGAGGEPNFLEAQEWAKMDKALKFIHAEVGATLYLARYIMLTPPKPIPTSQWLQDYAPLLYYGNAGDLPIPVAHYLPQAQVQLREGARDAMRKGATLGADADGWTLRNNPEEGNHLFTTGPVKPASRPVIYARQVVDATDTKVSLQYYILHAPEGPWPEQEALEQRLYVKPFTNIYESVRDKFTGSGPMGPAARWDVLLVMADKTPGGGLQPTHVALSNVTWTTLPEWHATWNTVPRDGNRVKLQLYGGSVALHTPARASLPSALMRYPEAYDLFELPVGATDKSPSSQAPVLWLRYKGDWGLPDDLQTRYAGPPFLARSEPWDRPFEWSIPSSTIRHRLM